VVLAGDRPAARGARAPGEHRAVDPEKDHHADDGADEPAEVEFVVVADVQQAGEDEPADERAGEAEQHRGEEAHGVAAGHQEPADEPGDDAEDDGSDHVEVLSAEDGEIRCLQLHRHGPPVTP
jgi:hypothetical protein